MPESVPKLRVAPVVARALLDDGDLESIRLRIISPTFGVAEARVRGVHLHCLCAERRVDGTIRVHPPKILRRRGDGGLGPAYGLPPGAREEIERAIRALWERADAETARAA